MKALCSMKVRSGLFLIVALVGFLVSCSNEKPAAKSENSLSKMDLNGKVRSLTETVYDAEGQSMEIQKRGMRSRAVHLFNEQGNSVEESYFKPDGSQKSIATIKYNKKGQIIENVLMNSDGDQEYKETFEYDRSGHLVKKDHLNMEGTVYYSETCKYDKEGNEIERNCYWTDNSMGTIILSQREDGTIEKEFQRSLGRQGSQVTKILFKYDDNGNRIEQAYYKPDGSLNVKYVSKFDGKGNKIETDIYNSGDKMESRSVYKYDEKGNMIGHGHGNGESENALEIVYDKKYDEKGNMIEEIIDYGQRRSKVAFKYDMYDKYGNWLVKTETVTPLSGTGKVYLVMITEREIKYY